MWTEFLNAHSKKELNKRLNHVLFKWVGKEELSSSQIPEVEQEKYKNITRMHSMPTHTERVVLDY